MQCGASLEELVLDAELGLDQDNMQHETGQAVFD
jgi:hypothetical protein